MSARSRTDARQLVEAALAESALRDGIERSILGEPVDPGRYWVFFYQGKAYIERDELDAMLVGNAPIVVPKDGGDILPEYRADRVTMRDGAEVWEVLDDGTQRLYAVLRNQEWIPQGS